MPLTVVQVGVGGTGQTTALIPSGTIMLFVQTAAPTGWTKNTTTGDNSALRVVTGTASNGGSVAFTTAFASGLSANATTLTTTQMPAHSHSFSGGGYGLQNGGGDVSAGPDKGAVGLTNTGGGGSHVHTLPSFAVQYVDVIRATKD